MWSAYIIPEKYKIFQVLNPTNEKVVLKGQAERLNSDEGNLKYSIGQSTHKESLSETSYQVNALVIYLKLTLKVLFRMLQPRYSIWPEKQILTLLDIELFMEERHSKLLQS